MADDKKSIGDKSPSILDLSKSSPTIDAGKPVGVSALHSGLAALASSSLFDPSKISALSPAALPLSSVTMPSLALNNLAPSTISLFDPNKSASLFAPNKTLEELTRPSLALTSIALSSAPLLELSNSASILSAGTSIAELLSVPDHSAGAFRMPALGEITRLATCLPPNWLSPAVGLNPDLQLTQLLRAANTLHTPWLQNTQPLQSLTGLAHLTTVGVGLTALDPFAPKLTTLLRTELGDWRQPIDWTRTNLLDPIARTALYVDRGLNLDLVHFPRSAFVESVALLGFDDDVRAAPATPPSEEELALLRTNKAHDRLQRFEIKIRAFISAQMKAVFGDNWPKHQLPGDVYKDWSYKSEQDRDQNGIVRPLIDYADFAHYVKIITRKDNWEKIFKPHFRRQESVMESFQRLYPIRLCTMHARPITPDDELYLLAETTRLLKVIA